jgi:hypothetical protein
MWYALKIAHFGRARGQNSSILYWTACIKVMCDNNSEETADKHERFGTQQN